MGYEVLHVAEGKRPFPSDLKSSGTTIENASLRFVVDPQTGCITSLFDKKTSFETLERDGCGNELQAFKDTPKDYDAWKHRSRDVRRGAHAAPRRRLSAAGRGRSAALGGSRDAQLAELEIRPGRHSLYRQRSRDGVE